MVCRFLLSDRALRCRARQRAFEGLSWAV